MWHEKTLDGHSNVDTISLSWIISISDLNYFAQKGPFLIVAILLILKDMVLWGKLGTLETEGALRGKNHPFPITIILI